MSGLERDLNQHSFIEIIFFFISYFLCWNFISCCSHINFLIDVDTGNDEEDPRPLGQSCTALQCTGQFGEKWGNLSINIAVQYNVDVCFESLNPSSLTCG